MTRERRGPAGMAAFGIIFFAEKDGWSVGRLFVVKKIRAPRAAASISLHVYHQVLEVRELLNHAEKDIGIEKVK